MEHRCYPRVAVAVPVQIQKGEACYGPFATGDVSLEGVFIHSGMVPAGPFEVMTLRFRIPRDPAGVREVRAAVVHRRPGGLGFLFTSADGQFIRELRRLLRETVTYDAAARRRVFHTGPGGDRARNVVRSENRIATLLR